MHEILLKKDCSLPFQLKKLIKKFAFLYEFRASFEGFMSYFYCGLSIRPVPISLDKSDLNTIAGHRCFHHYRDKHRVD